MSFVNQEMEEVGGVSDLCNHTVFLPVPADCLGRGAVDLRYLRYLRSTVELSVAGSSKASSKVS